MVDQATIDRVAAAIESAEFGYRMTLIRLVDGVNTYELEMQGVVTLFVDNDDASAVDQLYAHVRSVKRRWQAQAVIAALAHRASGDV